MQEPVITVGILSGKEIGFSFPKEFISSDGIAICGIQQAVYRKGKICWQEKEYDELSFTPQQDTSSFFELQDVTIGINFHWERKEVQRFKGELKIIVEDDRLTAINIIPIEDYLTSVISSEMSATASLELLKAHAVISRSWLLNKLKVANGKLKVIMHPDNTANFELSTLPSQLIKWYDHEAHKNFDVCADDHCQRYQGITRTSTPQAIEAVFATRGEVLMYEGEICDARFSKCCGGAFEEFQNCWENVKHPYLIGQRDSKTETRLPDLTKEAEAHVRHMPEAYEKLKERYAGSSLDVNVCHLGEENGIPYAEFEFVPGRPLSELMDECLDRQDVEGFHNLFAEYLERVGYGEDVPVADFDLIFANILVDGDHWTLIDYEWTFDRPIETRALAFRAVYCYVLEDERRNALELDRILDRLGITENEARQYREQEREFQKYVTGQKLSMGEIRNLLGGEIYKPTEWIGRFRQTEGELRVQIYEDKGQGFSEENSYFPENVYAEEKQAEFTVNFDGNVHYLRLDPAMCACVCKIRELTMNGQPVPLQDKKVFTTNGKILKSEEGADHPSVIFATEDPNMTIRADVLNRQAENTLSVKMEIVQIPQAMAKDMMGVEKKGAAAWVFGQR